MAEQAKVVANQFVDPGTVLCIGGDVKMEALLDLITIDPRVFKCAMAFHVMEGRIVKVHNVCGIVQESA